MKPQDRNLYSMPIACRPSATSRLQRPPPHPPSLRQHRGKTKSWDVPTTFGSRMTRRDFTAESGRTYFFVARVSERKSAIIASSAGVGLLGLGSLAITAGYSIPDA